MVQNVGLSPEALVQRPALGQPEAKFDLQWLSLLHSLPQGLTVLHCLQVISTCIHETQIMTYEQK